MTQITLTPEQTEQLKGAHDTVLVVDATGKVVGELTRIVFSDERIAEAKRRIRTESSGVTTQELLRKLQR
jgi:hypothetical protein